MLPHTPLTLQCLSAKQDLALKNGPPLPENLVQARRLRGMGISLSGLLLLGGLGMALVGDVPLPHAPSWVPKLLMLSSTVSVGVLTAAKVAMGEELQIEVHKGRIYVQYGVPVSGPVAAPNSIQVRPTGDVRGNGAFATVDIPRGTCLGEYEGDLLNEAAYWARYPSGVSDYCIRIDQEWTIDAAERARCLDVFSPCHMNHSASRFNVVRSTNRAAKRILFFTKTDVKAGEELLLDYGRLYWRGREHLELD
eukprot:jgi/Botrbrau1/2416/Bobra.0395s0042.2